MYPKLYHVNAILCSHKSKEAEVYDALNSVTQSLDQSWSKLKAAKKIVVKVNAVWYHDSIQTYRGVYRELVDPKVMQSVLRLLKEKTNAAITVLDTTLTGTESDVYFKPLLKELGIQFINGSLPPVQWYDVPGGGCMFNRYLLSSHFADADAVVSVAKLKSHRFTGITLCTKNLFGCSPLPPQGRPRAYFHHMVRLPYSMVDFGMILKPCLNIIDGLIGQTGQEWGGKGRVTDVLIAGDHVTASDVCGAHLMGNDPAGDWPTPPFRRERNYIKLAADKGFGTLDLDQIDFTSEVKGPLAKFNSIATDSPELILRWRKSAAEQGLFYRKNKAWLTERYASEYIFLQMGEVVWHGKDLSALGSRRELSGNNKDETLWLKYVDPLETEGENFSIYERELEDMNRCSMCI